MGVPLAILYKTFLDRFIAGFTVGAIKESAAGALRAVCYPTAGDERGFASIFR